MTFIKLPLTGRILSHFHWFEKILYYYVAQRCSQVHAPGWPLKPWSHPGGAALTVYSYWIYHQAFLSGM
jgi:hypothetical protein